MLTFDLEFESTRLIVDVSVAGKSRSPSAGNWDLRRLEVVDTRSLTKPILLRFPIQEVRTFRSERRVVVVLGSLAARR